jgi:hypothetical protein
VSQYSDGIAQLMVKKIEQEDAGLYKCRATNELGSIETEAKMTVAVRKSLVILIRNIHIEVIPLIETVDFRFQLLAKAALIIQRHVNGIAGQG